MLLPIVQDITEVVNSYHPRAFGLQPLTLVIRTYTVTQEEAVFDLHIVITVCINTNYRLLIKHISFIRYLLLCHQS